MAMEEQGDDGVELVTLAEWGRQHRYAPSSARALRAKEGFPAPAGYRDVPKHRDPTAVPQDQDPGRGVTVDEFAALIGVSAGQVRRVATTHAEPLPERINPAEPVAYPIQGRRRLDAMVAWWHRRPAATTRVAVYDPADLAPFVPAPTSLPPLGALGVDPRARVSLTRFAKIIGEDHSTVGQYRTRYPHTMPRTADGRRVQDVAPRERIVFYVEDLYRWWSARPGRRRPYDQPDQAASASAGPAPSAPGRGALAQEPPQLG
ncbi:hypothetical protein [Nocardiopsis synnemataformans]|uniref:hypothetical protein n=1 Tax=Nocardiopsis synnemataformans TaxID=61305 RepID=UPI003EBD1057